jgi:signal transduction histidine kinase
MPARRKHLFAIVITSLLAILLFYLGDLAWLGRGQLQNSFFSRQAYHEICLVVLAGPVIWATFVFRIRGGVIVSVLESLAIVPHAVEFSPYADSFFRLATFAIISVLLAGVIGGQINSKEELKKQQTRLERLLSQTIDVQERERRYLARELHDEAAQTLVDISHEIDEIKEAGQALDEVMQKKLAHLRSEIETVLEGTRRFIRGLRPPLLEEMGLGPSVKWLAEELTEGTGIEVIADVQPLGGRLSESLELNVFRIAQEALTNAKRHSQATRIRLSLMLTDGKIRLQVEDNGVGFTMPGQDKLVNEGKFGLVGIRERTRLVGGTVHIQSVAGKGTVVTATFPIQRAEQELA